MLLSYLRLLCLQMSVNGFFSRNTRPGCYRWSNFHHVIHAMAVFFCFLMPGIILATASSLNFISSWMVRHMISTVSSIALLSSIWAEVYTNPIKCGAPLKPVQCGRADPHTTKDQLNWWAQMTVGLSTTANFGGLCGCMFGNVRDKTSNITWRYATPCLPVVDCKINDLEWPW